MENPEGGKGLPQNKRVIWCFGCDDVVPLWVEVISGDIEGCHLGIADLDALGIDCRVEFAGDGEAGVIPKPLSFDL